MIDPLLSLAFSMHSNRGVYALLLGSGISRAAEIPTGWEIVKDLIGKLAHLEDEDCQLDPEAWFREKHGTEPDYAALLAAVARSPSERSQLLKSYFEPSEEEQERGVKTPTEAHQAIAQLVLKGYIKVILTTNFDRLTEKALEAVGIHPIVISSVDGIQGALPLVHAPCTVIKLHGDYLDSRIRNTPDELAEYESAQNELLDRVLDEYGLIICGWSGEWDTALRAAFTRCPSRRFSTYWTHISQPAQAAEGLIVQRTAEKIAIEGASQFFENLLDKVTSLEELDRPHPLSSKLAIASVKRYLVEDRFRIKLADLVHDETEKVYSLLTGETFEISPNYSFPIVFSRMEKYEASLEILMSILVTGTYWGRSNQAGIWAKSLQRVLDSENRGGGSVAILNSTLYPALLLHYATGISCLAGNKYETLKIMFSVSRKERDRRDAIFSIRPGEVINSDALNQHLDQRNYVPISDRMRDILREPLREIVPDDVEYEDLFDRFEYLRALIDLDNGMNVSAQRYDRAPIGRFGWRNRHYGNHVSSIFAAEIQNQAHEWPPLKVGYFGNDTARLAAVKTAFDAQISSLYWG